MRRPKPPIKGGSALKKKRKRTVNIVSFKYCLYIYIHLGILFMFI